MIKKHLIHFSRERVSESSSTGKPANTERPPTLQAVRPE